MFFCFWTVLPCWELEARWKKKLVQIVTEGLVAIYQISYTSLLDTRHLTLDRGKWQQIGMKETCGNGQFYWINYLIFQFRLVVQWLAVLQWSCVCRCWGLLLCQSPSCAPYPNLFITIHCQVPWAILTHQRFVLLLWRSLRLPQPHSRCFCPWLSFIA